MPGTPISGTRTAGDNFDWTRIVGNEWWCALLVEAGTSQLLAQCSLRPWVDWCWARCRGTTPQLPEHSMLRALTGQRRWATAP
jgi:hypothetical protein